MTKVIGDRPQPHLPHRGPYDLGMAVGAGGVGLLAAATGYPIAFVLTAAAMLPALHLARRETPEPQPNPG